MVGGLYLEKRMWRMGGHYLVSVGGVAVAVQ